MSLLRVLVACAVAISVVKLVDSVCEYVAQCGKTKEVEKASVEMMVRFEQQTVEMQEHRTKHMADMEATRQLNTVRHDELMAQLEAQVEAYARQTAAMNKLYPKQR